MRNFLLLLSLLISCVACTEDEISKGSIYGVVTTEKNAEPMRATGVELYRNGSLLLKTVTFDDGHYEFKDLEAGEYELKVVAQGYVDASYPVVVESSRTARADMQLKRLETYMTISTLAVTNIQGDQATFNGTYRASASYSPDENGFLYAQTPTPSHNGKTIAVKGEFTCTVDGLNKGTWYVQAYAKNRVGYAYGEVVSFEISGTPVVVTKDAANVSANAATLNAEIEYPGDPVYTERGFVYSASFPHPTIDDPNDATIRVKVPGSSGTFSANISGLTDNTTYYVRAYVTGDAGTVYGETVEFAHSDFLRLSDIGIMVHQYDISAGVDWDQAQQLCASSTIGGYSDWRLPTIGECNNLYKSNKKSPLKFQADDYYWTSEKYYSSGHYFYNYQYGTSSGTSYNSSELRVRCVRTIR